MKFNKEFNTSEGTKLLYKFYTDFINFEVKQYYIIKSKGCPCHLVMKH